MNIVVNGKNQELNQALTLQDFITQNCPNPKRVIAEVNENIIKRNHWADFKLQEADKIELVTFVGGG